MGVALCNGDFKALNWRMVGWWSVLLFLFLLPVLTQSVATSAGSLLFP